jgi:hypothetical protein
MDDVPLGEYRPPSPSPRRKASAKKRILIIVICVLGLLAGMALSKADADARYEATVGYPEEEMHVYSGPTFDEYEEEQERLDSGEQEQVDAVVNDLHDTYLSKLSGICFYDTEDELEQLAQTSVGLAKSKGHYASTTGILTQAYVLVAELVAAGHPVDGSCDVAFAAVLTNLYSS